LAQVELGSEASDWVTEYLAHNELGRAFATIVESLDELEVGPPPAVMGCLGLAYKRMGNPDDGREAWGRLNLRSES
jgi:hypothetical protein